MIGKRAIKLKPDTCKITARAGNREIYSNRSKERAKAREGKHAGSGPRPSWYKTQLPLRPRRVGTSPFPSEPASRSTVSLCVEAGGVRPKRLRKSVTIVVPTYGFASQRCQTEDICAMAKHTVKKDIHTANEEEQVKICRKLKGFLVIRQAVTQ
jgi:hypothetical protein